MPAGVCVGVDVLVDVGVQVAVAVNIAIRVGEGVIVFPLTPVGQGPQPNHGHFHQITLPSGL